MSQPVSAPRRRITLHSHRDWRAQGTTLHGNLAERMFDRPPIAEPIHVTHRREDETPVWLSCVGVALIGGLFIAGYALLG